MSLAAVRRSRVALIHPVVANDRRDPQAVIREDPASSGGLRATVTFEIAKRGFVFFVANFANYKAIYGAVAALPVFLIWVYLSWTIVLAGAVLTATLPEWRRPQAVRQWRRKRPT